MAIVFETVELLNEEAFRQHCYLVKSATSRKRGPVIAYMVRAAIVARAGVSCIIQVTNAGKARGVGTRGVVLDTVKLEVQ